MRMITLMNTISKYWITHNNLILTTESFAEINDLVSYKSFKFAFIMHNKLKAFILITSVDLFYYRLSNTF
jgi:hypothetical protein